MKKKKKKKPSLFQGNRKFDVGVITNSTCRAGLCRWIGKLLHPLSLPLIKPVTQTLKAWKKVSRDRYERSLPAVTRCSIIYLQDLSSYRRILRIPGERGEERTVLSIVISLSPLMKLGRRENKKLGEFERRRRIHCNGENNSCSVDSAGRNMKIHFERSRERERDILLAGNWLVRALDRN